MFGIRRQPVVTQPVVEKPVQVITPEPQPVVNVPAPAVVNAPAPAVVNQTVATPVVTTVPSRWDQFREAVSRRIQDIVIFIFSIAALLIVVRFALLALNAGTSSAFAGYMMAWSDPLVAPFKGLFSNPTVAGFTTFEVADVVALLVYAIVTSIVCRIVSLLLTPYVPGRRIVRP
ncbi:MAG TPA: hypothetical protein VGO93_30480 [Candidatus Xenobia bacterium]